MGARRHGLSVLPPRRLRFGKLQHWLDIIGICGETLASSDYTLVIRQRIDLPSKARRQFESAMSGFGANLRGQRIRQTESGHEENNTPADSRVPSPPDA